MSLFGQTLGAAVDLLAPPRCLVCRAVAAPPWCDACARTIDRLRLAGGCRRCGGSGGPGHGCWSDSAPVATTVAAYRYRGPVATTVVAAKVRGATAAWPALGRLLARRVTDRFRDRTTDGGALHSEPRAASRSQTAERAVGLSPVAAVDIDVVTWIPADRRRVRKRGVDHARELARPVAHSLGVPLGKLLTTRPHRRDQAHLSTAERRQLVGDAFTMRRSAPDITDVRVLLVDDVMTTGATLSVAAAALVAAGTRRVDASVLARAGNHPLGREGASRSTSEADAISSTPAG